MHRLKKNASIFRYTGRNTFKTALMQQHSKGQALPVCAGRNTFEAAMPESAPRAHLSNEILLQLQRLLLVCLGLGISQCVEVEAQVAHLAAQVLTGLSPASALHTKELIASLP